jgi:hypothetical protein
VQTHQGSFLVASQSKVWMHSLLGFASMHRIGTGSPSGQNEIRQDFLCDIAATVRKVGEVFVLPDETLEDWLETIREPSLSFL